MTVWGKCICCPQPASSVIGNWCGLGLLPNSDTSVGRTSRVVLESAEVVTLDDSDVEGSIKAGSVDADSDLQDSVVTNSDVQDSDTQELDFQDDPNNDIPNYGAFTDACDG
ncbi:hypothetical protein PG984_012855 [Apiospora sp. TS-2023a]